MSSRAQMDACGVLCHLEVHPFITAINWAIADASSTGVTAMDKADLPRLFLCQERCLDVQLMCSGLMRCAQSAVPFYCLNDEVEQVPLSQSITYSSFGQGPVDADGLM